MLRITLQVLRYLVVDNSTLTDRANYPPVQGCSIQNRPSMLLALKNVNFKIQSNILVIKRSLTNRFIKMQNLTSWNNYNEHASFYAKSNSIFKFD